MSISSFLALCGLARDLPKFMAEPITLESASDNIRIRLENRNNLFLKLAETSIYDCSYSPYRQLLLNTGCEYGDLCNSVRSQGLEATLSKLRSEGVWLSLEEFKSQTSIRRGNLKIGTEQNDFNNIGIPYRGISRKTSGSRSRGTDTNYSWRFMAEEAETEALLYQWHGVKDLPLALWYPAHLSMAGIHNMLMNIKCHRPPEKWFSQTENMSSRERIMMIYLTLWGRMFGLRVPSPEYAPLDQPLKVASWLAETKKNKGSAVIRTYSSSGVRIVKTALNYNLDIAGTTIFVGGEPLSREGYQFMASAGVRVLPRYVSTETGLIAASCGERENTDSMHVYLDRMAVIHDKESNRLLFTTILQTTPKLLLNTDLGDTAFLQNRQCNCIFGKLGMDLFVSDVRTTSKQTLEGMSIFLYELDAIVGQIIREEGGRTEDYQFWEHRGEKGLPVLIIAVSPTVKGLDEKNFIARVLTRLGKHNLRCRLSSDIWRKSGSITFLRDEPRPSPGQKLLRLIPDPRA